VDKRLSSAGTNTTLRRKALAQEGITLKPVHTRFRAYQLGSPGSSFSYFAGGHFTLIEARLTEVNKATIIQEMAECGVEAADLLHITSWDSDHCCASELTDVLALAMPRKIECPGYEPHTDNGKECADTIATYKAMKQNSNRPVELRWITPDYIAGLEPASELAFNDILYHPTFIDPDCSNNNSTVKFFRGGSFNVLSLGDVEDQNVSSYLRRRRTLQRETDLMILSHHGADNGFTNKPFLSHIDPALAICSSNYDNQHDHPRDEIRELLHERGIRLMTTKTGDIIVKSIGDHAGGYRAVNLKAGSTEVSSTCDFYSKKARLLQNNEDTLRQLFGKRHSYPR
jgi:competence protein ComEC